MSVTDWTDLPGFMQLFFWMPEPFQIMLPVLLVVVIGVAIWRVFKG